jgi:hypothetical protein
VSTVINRLGKTAGVLMLSGGLALGISACNTSKYTTNPAPSGSPSATTAAPVKGVSMAEFNQVQNGMTYQQVSTIFRSPGTLQADTSVAGYHDQMYMWNGTTVGANANVTFTNDTVSANAQLGLS